MSSKPPTKIFGRLKIDQETEDRTSGVGMIDKR